MNIKDSTDYIDVNDFLDERNRELWEYVCANHNVSIKKSNEDNYLVTTKKDGFDISVLSNDKCSASFTHELLHIWLSMKISSPYNYINKHIWKDDKFRMIFSNDLVEHIGNVLEHRKMLSKFIEMGYKRSDFMADYNTYKMDDYVLSVIISNFKNDKIYDSLMIEEYIKKYFAIKCCPNTSFNYTRYKIRLIILDWKLFKILERFVKDWDKLKIDDKYIDCIDITNKFCLNMSKWVKRKEII